MLNFKKWEGKRNYSEEFQSLQTKFSFANRVGDDIIEMFKPVLCKDFLGDCLYAEELGEPVSIYGFTYNPAEMRLDRDKTRIVVRQPNQKVAQHFESNVAVLSFIEKSNRLKNTEITPLGNKIYLIEADPWWMGKIWRISLLGYVLKCMSYPHPDPAKWVDSVPKDSVEFGHLKEYREALTHVLNDLHSHCENECPGSVLIGDPGGEVSLTYTHHNQGIFSSLHDFNYKEKAA